MTKIQVRRGTAAAAAANNEILAAGELGCETDTKRVKVGDGVTAWNSLPYISLAIGTTSTTAKAGNYTPTYAEVIASLGFTPENVAGKNQPNGYAGVGSDGFIPSAVLPSYVDDVVEYANLAAFPATGSSGKIFTALDTSKIYRWSGSTYVEISPSPGSTDAVPEGATNRYYTDARAQAANASAINAKESAITAGTTSQYWRGDKSFQTLDKTAVGLSNVDNTADLSKPVSTATQTALDGKQSTSGKDVAGGYAGLNGSGQLTAATTGNAATATRLMTARNINGVSFDGSADINPVSAATVGGNWLPPGYVASNYYFCNSAQTSSTSNGLGNGTVRVTPWVVTANTTITKLFAEFTVAGDANSVYRIGIWNHDPATGKPGALLLDAGSISTGSGNAGTTATGGTPGCYELTVSQALTPGLYWVGGAVQGVATTQPTMRSVVNTTIPMNHPLGTSLPGVNPTIFGWLLTAQTGAFGSLASAIVASGTSNAARIGFKVA
jgi:hypothetical protein